nr:serine/threonine-protein kinase haspin [Pogona vitticeps]
MERPRPRLLGTYTGLRGRPGRGGGGGGGSRAGLRVVRPAAPWISPAVDQKRLFSTSSSGGASSSSFSPPSTTTTTFEDPDFLPPKRRARKAPQRRGKAPPRSRKPKGAKENKAPPPDPVPLGCWPSTPLCRNVTRRRAARATPPLPALTPVGLRRRGAPLLCSTPELPVLTPSGATRGLGEEEGADDSVLQGSAFSPFLGGRRSCLRGASREDGRSACGDALSELSLLMMDPADEQAVGESLVLFDKTDAGRSWRKSQPRSSPCPGRSLCTSFQSRSLARPQLWNQAEANLGLPEGLGASPAPSVPSPSQGTDSGQRLPATPKANDAFSLRGAFQLQVTVCDDGKLALTLPRNAAPLPNKRQRLSLQAAAVPLKKRRPGLNGAFLEEASVRDKSSPRLQPVVLLDNRVVLSWLASRSSRKQGADPCISRGECPLELDSPGALPGGSDATSHNQVAPTCGAGTTGRKACISGFSSNRWGQRRRLKPGRRKKCMGWKELAETSRLQESFRNPKEEDSAFVCPSSLDSSFRDASLWRRIRASFSLHKKKKILSEPESCNSSITPMSVRSHFTEVLKTPFTQTLGYSICPTSSMVLLSSMTSSFFSSEATLTDADKVFGECQQTGPISFETCIPPDRMRKCEKIGEGVFGEVFKTEGERGSVALKIIPIEGSDKVNGEPQKTFSDILPEIIISKELSLLADEERNHTSGFICLYSVHCVQGAYPEPLLNAWDRYHRLRVSENDRPDFFGDQQLFVVLEFEFGGTDLENMRRRQLSSVATAKSILHQVTASLAVAEEALRFEHRDLHWGNVLVKKTDLKEVSVTLNGETRLLRTHGVLVNIIDYTFSRLERDGLTVYCDLSGDEEVFQGRGDYQFDVYRQMREENGNQWADYFPHSNVLWLHYLVDKLLSEVSYKKKATTAPLRQVQKQLKLFSQEVLGFRSATEVLNTSTIFQRTDQG